jgi:hypothetical protein
MKAYFSYKPGSYWIYKDDSTGVQDSTYIASFTHYTDCTNSEYPGITTEFISIYFKSLNLYNLMIQYDWCNGPNFLTVCGIDPTLPSDETESGPFAYDPNWPANQRITSFSCYSPGGSFFYKAIDSIPINNIIYKNVIYSELKSIDSSATNKYYYYRSIYFAKNIGIIKYFEVDRNKNVHRAFSLLRNKAIQ